MSKLTMAPLPAATGETLGPLDQTPLHLAVDIGDPQLAAALVAGGAPLGALDFDGKTALHLALEGQEVSTSSTSNICLDVVSLAVLT